jgi:O-antigen/teichoic acid export membrane protein
LAAIFNRIKRKLFALINNAGFKRYFLNTSWLFSEQLLRIFSSLLVGVWVARYLGPIQFGIFSYALAFTAIFAGIAKLGLDSILVRELLNQPEKQEFYLGTAFWLKMIGAFLVIGIVAAILPFTGNDVSTNLFILIISAGLLFQSFEVVEFYLQSQVLGKVVSICKVIQVAFSSVIKIYLLISEAELIHFVLITFFDTLSLAFSYFIAYKIMRAPSFYKHFDLKIAKKLIKDSWPLMFSALVVMIYMRIDQIMIKKILGEYEVGIFSAAVRLSEVFNFIPILIVSSFFPAILNAKKQSEELYKKRMQSLYTLMVCIAISIALPMTFLADWLIVFLFGDSYLEAGKVLVIHIWGSIFVFLGVASGNWFITENQQMLSFWRTFAGMLINVLFNFLLIPKYGLIGAAISTLIGQFVAAYLFDLFHIKTRLMFVMKTKSLTGYNLFFTK